MTIQSKNFKILRSSLKKSLGLPHQQCKDLIDSHIKSYPDYYNIDYDILNDKFFQDFLNVLSSKLKESIETTGSNPLAIIANGNYRALLLSELSVLYDFSQQSPFETNDVHYIVFQLGTLEQIFSLPIPLRSHCFKMSNFRQLFSAYINTFQTTNGQYLVVVRELDSLAYCQSMSKKILEQHMRSVTCNLICAGEVSPSISSIAFENINNINSLSQSSAFFDNKTGNKGDPNFQELSRLIAKRDVLAFSCR